LIFNEQTSTMHEINADISQEFLISSILFLFFNASLIKKCKALRIKIEMLNFVNNIKILIYNRFIEEIWKTLRKIHDVCVKWTWTHDTTFASEKYKLIYIFFSSLSSVTFRCKYWTIKFLSEFYCSLLISLAYLRYWLCLILMCM